MSYDLHFKLFKNGKLMFNACFNELKSINQTNYRADLDPEVKPCVCSLPTPSGTDDSSGNWYDANSFAAASEAYQHQYDDLAKRLFEKKNVRLSPAYYSFYTSEDRQNLAEDIEELEEAMKYLTWKISVCEKMIGIMALYGDGNFYKETSDEDDPYEYDDCGDIKVYIFAM